MIKLSLTTLSGKFHKCHRYVNILFTAKTLKIEIIFIVSALARTVYDEISHTTGIGPIENHGTRLPIKWSQRWNGSAVRATQEMIAAMAGAELLVKKVWRYTTLKG